MAAAAPVIPVYYRAALQAGRIFQAWHIYARIEFYGRAIERFPPLAAQPDKPCPPAVGPVNSVPLPAAAGFLNLVKPNPFFPENLGT